MEEHPHESIDTVFNCVIPYIHNGDDRNTVSLVCRKWYEIDCMTRKHLTVHVVYSRQPSHVVYSCQPSRLAQRFPYLESLTLKGFPRAFKKVQYIDLRPWIKEIVVSFKCLKSLDIRRVILRDSDLEQITTSRGEDLRVLKINNCKGLNGNGFTHIGSHAVNLKDFACCELENFEQEGDQYAGLKFPPNMRISINSIDQIVLLFVLPLSNQLSELNLRHLNKYSQCLLIRRCPNLEALYIDDMFGDNVLQVIGQSCMKLRKLKIRGLVATHMGLIALAQGCLELECLHINFSTHISNKFLECIGCLKNLKDFQITLPYTDISVLDSGIRVMLIGCSKLERLRINDVQSGSLTGVSLGYMGKYGHNLRYLSLDAGLVDSGIRAMLIGCSKLESLRLRGCCRDLTNVGLGYIGKYGHNLRHLSLGGNIRNFEKGLVKLSKGCPRLRKLEIHERFFSKHELSTLMVKFQSLRYMWVLDRHENIVLAKTRLLEVAYSKSVLNSNEQICSFVTFWRFRWSLEFNIIYHGVCVSISNSADRLVSLLLLRLSAVVATCTLLLLLVPTQTYHGFGEAATISKSMNCRPRSKIE
ncbi:hypothetical protein Tco_0333144 [Tanacetum coccineum]